MRHLPLVALLAATPALAADPDVHCDIHADPGDRVSKGKDLVIGENERVENAIAVDGNVLIKKGASVKSAIALRGNVTVEPGAKVRESALALDGTVKTSDPRQVKGTTLSLGKGLHIRSDEGNDVNLSMSFNGKDLGQTLVDAILKDVRQCKVTHGPSKADGGT